NKLAIDATRLSHEEIACELLRVVRPDLYGHMRRLVLGKNVDGHGIRIDRIVAGPLRHGGFPKMLMSRINLVRHLFFEVYPETLDQAVEHFQRDIHPEQEIAMWEAMASVYLDYKQECKPDLAQCKAAFDVLLTLTVSPLPSRRRTRWPVLSAKDIEFLHERWK